MDYSLCHGQHASLMHSSSQEATDLLCMVIVYPSKAPTYSRLGHSQPELHHSWLEQTCVH